MTPSPSSMVERITHEEAREIAQRLINSHFNQDPHARVSIPARPEYDDDIRIMVYIEQQASPIAAQGVTPDDTEAARGMIDDAFMLRDIPHTRQRAIEMVAGLLAKNRIAALRATPSWMPIETAPKDGTAVWIARVDGYRVVARNWGGSWFKDTGAYASDCTHWQPLPATPSAAPITEAPDTTGEKG